MAAAGGWMARAESLLEDAEECAGHGWLALDRAPFTDIAAERQQLAAAALAIARRYGDADLEYDAMALLERVAARRRSRARSLATSTGGGLSGLIRRTAEHHVAHMLSKLDLRSRSESSPFSGPALRAYNDRVLAISRAGATLQKERLRLERSL